MGVSSEMDSDDARSLPDEGEAGAVVLDGAQVAAMRRLMHELSNVLTGVMISGGLLAEYLHPGKPTVGYPAGSEGKALWHYATGVCAGCERGCLLLRELRSQLLAACGEADGGVFGTSSGGQEPKPGSSKNLESF